MLIELITHFSANTMMLTYRTSPCTYFGTPACQLLERFKKTGIIVQFGVLPGYRINIHSDWCILHTVRSGITASQNYNLLVDLCPYVDSIPHSNDIHCTALCHGSHAWIRVLRALLAKQDPQDMP